MAPCRTKLATFWDFGSLHQKPLATISATRRLVTPSRAAPQVTVSNQKKKGRRQEVSTSAELGLCGLVLFATFVMLTEFYGHVGNSDGWNMLSAATETACWWYWFLLPCQSCS